jgi:hypothetical protein
MDEALEVLEGALALGRQADLFAADAVQARMEAARAKAPVAVQTTMAAVPEPVPEPTRSVLSKIKGWFAAKETA